ncbi:exodeoxyribonuclease VII large subunit [Shouchella patagoniensis]|uniref:exodeoxyribonuclease VII large subunit n=1 Tax=Shouchella patagoniensis TaxID=228576 RepID=UPI000994C427|nr:exodeoxyribonuclease VII large subunit [Shouchella patagoniensis]
MNQAWTVSEATRYIKQLLEDDPQLPEVWIRGEVSNFKQHSRGHMYFTIKDDASRMQAVMFAGHNRFLRFKPENGMNVLIRGEINVYEPYGQYQFYAKEMQPDGIGSLHVAYERLKKQLEEEGVFAQERKRAIPRFPKHIAIITSPTGAAIKDMMTTLKRRFPQVRVTLLPVLVQGDAAPSSIVRAIEQASLANIFDLLIVGRGGGSIEELWAFNEEVVARAIVSSSAPVISAVGHETDFTISDFSADLRAPTPTAAAELAVPDYRELVTHIQALNQRLRRNLQEQMQKEKVRLERISRSYAFRYPKQLVEQKEQQLDQLLDRLTRIIHQDVLEKKQKYTYLHRSIARQHPRLRLQQLRKEHHDKEQRLLRGMRLELNEKKQLLGSLISNLELLSPLKIMERGYSLAYRGDTLVKSVHDANINDQITVTLRNGRIYTKVTGKDEIDSGGETNG